MHKAPKTVEAYIAAAPKDMQPKLRQMRELILSAAPKVEEKISYSMPYYGYKGRLAYFAFAKEHIGLYIPPPIIAMHKDQLKKYHTAMATVRFPIDEKLPVTIIKKLVKARVKLNEKK